MGGGNSSWMLPLAIGAGVAAPFLFPAAAGAGAAGAAGATGAGAAGTAAALTGPELFLGTAGGANLAGMSTAGLGAAGMGGLGTAGALTGPELFYGTAGGMNLAGVPTAGVPAAAAAMPGASGFAMTPQMRDMLMRYGINRMGRQEQQQAQLRPPPVGALRPPGFRFHPTARQGMPQLPVGQVPSTPGMLRRPI